MDVLTTYPYAVLGPLVLAEGPVATVLAGTLVGAGLVLFWPILAVVVLADVLADTGIYVLGRLGNRRQVAPWLSRLGLTEERRVRLTATVGRNLPRVVLGAKAADLAAIPSYLAAGLARVPYRRFLAWVAPASAVRAAVLIGLGVVFGRQAADLLASPGTALGLAAVVALLIGAVQLLVRRLHRPLRRA